MTRFYAIFTFLFLRHLQWPEKGRLCPSVRPLTCHFFISSLTIWTTLLKLYMKLLDNGPLHLELYRVVIDERPHGCSMLGFSISGQVTQKWSQRPKYWIVIVSLLSNLRIWNLQNDTRRTSARLHDHCTIIFLLLWNQWIPNYIEWYWTNVCTIAQ